MDRRALPELAFDAEAPAVTLDDMLDDGQSQTRTPERAAPARVHPVEAFGDPRDMFARDSVALIGFDLTTTTRPSCCSSALMR